MAAPQGLCSFPGIDSIISASMVWSGGIAPSVCTIECTPQSFLGVTMGVLTFSFAGVQIQFPDCVVEESSLEISESGFIISLHIKDRRWRWQYGEISGRYNIRNPDGMIDRTTLKTPQELATLLLQAMGETNFDLSQLPNTARPEANWESDNPAQALDEMLNDLGCRLVLTLDNTVQVVIAGVGSSLPMLNSINDSYGISLQTIPDSVKLVGGRTRFNACWKLVPVGLDTDGSIKPIDKLSYTPTKGWANEDPDVFAGINVSADNRIPNPAEPARQLPDEYARQCALQSVFRWYRISEMCDLSAKHDQDGTPQSLGNIPGYGLVQKLWQVLPIEDVQANTYTDQADQITRSTPAIVEGTYMRGGDPPMYQNTQPMTKWYAGFSINKDLGIVELAEWAIKYDSTGNTTLPAELYLTVACGILDYNSRLPVRYTKEIKLGGQTRNTGPQIVQMEEIADAFLATYTVTPDPNQTKLQVKQVSSTKGSQFDVDKFATQQLQQIIASMQNPQTAQRRYPGILPLDLDGAIQQISWEVSAAGAFTTASLNTEFHAWIPSYFERRRQERAKRAENNAKKIMAKVGAAQRWLGNLFGKNKR